VSVQRNAPILYKTSPRRRAGAESRRRRTYTTEPAPLVQSSTSAPARSSQTRHRWYACTVSVTAKEVRMAKADIAALLALAAALFIAIGDVMQLRSAHAVTDEQ
jgi:hypothetical protein